jgi:GNAT superfamily N-acetyltransferase
MQSLAAEVWRLAPETGNGGASVGELAWGQGTTLAKGQQQNPYRLWHEDGRLMAWGIIFPPGPFRVSADRWEMSKAGLVWQTHPGRLELLDEILAWFEAETPGAPRQTSARAANADAITRIERHGYTCDRSAPWDLMNMRDLVDIQEPAPPPGYGLKTMREVGDIEKRVAVHRAAWEPSSLTEEKYAAAMSAWPYRADFDFVVEAPDGSLAASALGWYDGANRVGEFEPVGTHSAHRRLGLARAVMLFGMQRFRAAGATHAIVGCRGDADYPIPKLVYESIGFRELSRDLPFVQS